MKIGNHLFSFRWDNERVSTLIVAFIDSTVGPLIKSELTVVRHPEDAPNRKVARKTLLKRWLATPYARVYYPTSAARREFWQKVSKQLRLPGLEATE